VGGWCECLEIYCSRGVAVVCVCGGGGRGTSSDYRCAGGGGRLGRKPYGVLEGVSGRLALTPWCTFIRHGGLSVQQAEAEGGWVSQIWTSSRLIQNFFGWKTAAKRP
jgi:hypothetical protein